MNNTTIATLSNKDFTIGADGAFISQTRIAELIGVNQQTISKHIQTKSGSYNTNELSQLDAHSLAKVVGYYAAKGRENAIALLAQFAVAGVDEWIITASGVMPITATNPTTTTIDETGAFISQARVAELIGVSKQAIQKHVANNGCRYILNKLNQLEAKSLSAVVGHYAAKGKDKAIVLLTELADAGAQAFIYNEAGLTIEVTDPESDTRIDRLENMMMQLIEKVSHTTPTAPPTPRHPPVAIMRSTPVKQEKVVGDQLFTCMEFRNSNGYHNMDHALASVLGTRAQHIWYNTGTPLLRKSGRNAYPVEIWQQAINEVNAGVGVFSEASVKIIY